MCLPSYLNDETDSHTGIFVCTAECINYEKSLVGELFDSDVLYCIPGFLGSRVVIILILIGGPPYSVLGVFIYNDEFVFWRTTCIDTGHNVHCAQLADLSFFVAFQLRFGLLFK